MLGFLKRWRTPILLLVVGALFGGIFTALTSTRLYRLGMRVQSKADRTWHKYFGKKRPPAEDWKSPNYEVLPHVEGLSFPVRIVLHPTPPKVDSDPFYYVGELPGTIKLVTLGGDVHTVAEDLLNFKWKPIAELGLMGLDVDPDGKSLYATMPYWDEDDGVYRNKVEQLVVEGSPPQVTDRKVLLDMAQESTVASYCVQFVSVGPDDNLYVGVGAGGNKSDAQVPEKFAGKILRMSKDGKALPDNPFFSPKEPRSAQSYTWALGFRNPFDITWDPKTNEGIVSEVGPGIDRILRLERGINYCFGQEGGESRMRANSLYTWGPGGNFAPTGITIADASMFGEGDGEFLYLGLFGPVYIPGPNDGKHIMRFRFNPTGWLDSGPSMVARYEGKFFSSVTDVVAAHDAIYFAEFYGPGEPPHFGKGIVYRVERTGEPETQEALDPSLAGAARGEKLFTLNGCKACHDITTGSSPKEGPALGKLADKLDDRLNTAKYEDELKEFAAREGAYFKKHRPDYEAVLAASGSARVRMWFKHHIRDPRFDHPDGKMPGFPQLSDQDVDALADFLLGE